MREFYKKTFFFSFILIILFLVIENSLFGMENSYLLKRNCVEKSIDELKVLIFGSSESYYDINPEVFGDKSCNVANSNQDLYFDSKILSKYISYTKNLKLAIIPVSYFSLEYNINNSDEYWRKFFYYRYFGIKSPENNMSDIRNYSLIALYTPSKSREYILSGFKTNLISNVSTKGWFGAIDGNITEAVNPNDVAKRHTEYMKEGIFDQNLEILGSMVYELKKRGVEVVLVTLPVSSDYFNSINLQKYNKMYSQVQIFATSRSILYLNYLQDDRFLTSDFIDRSDHLNKISAQKFSQILHADIINR